VHFIVSAPRSGSTWLATALSGHPQLLATENRLFGMFCEIWRNRNGREQPRITADCWLESLARHTNWQQLGYANAAECRDALVHVWIDCLSDWLVQKSGKSLIVDKITPYLGTSPIVSAGIRQHFPDGKVILLVRDGRDVVTSGVFDWLGREPSDDDHPRTGVFLRGDRVTLNRFLDERSLNTWCRYWSEPVEEFRKNAFPADQVLTVRYESMHADMQRSLQEIFRFLNIEDSEEIARQCADAASFRAVTGREPGQAEPLAKARKGIAGDWVNWFTRNDAELFDQLAGRLLVELGYERDSSWVARCPERLGYGA
jgi:hypothetical protein